MDITPKRFRHVWAKTNRNTPKPAGWTYPLWAHLLDVATAAEHVWDHIVPEHLKTIIMTALGFTTANEARAFVCGMIGLHDLGKATPGFQSCAEDEVVLTTLTAQGIDIRTSGDDAMNRLAHGLASIAILQRYFEDIGAHEITELTAAFIGFHHGYVAHEETWLDAADECPGGPLGSTEWHAMQQNLLQAYLAAYPFSYPDPSSEKFDPCVIPIAGIATLADWIGSRGEVYLTEPTTHDLSAYVAESRRKTKIAWNKTGLTRTDGLHAIRWEDLWPERDATKPPLEPRPMQQYALQTPFQPGSLIIIEDETGAGKTEAAFIIASKLGGGSFVAMPTQATADALLKRYFDFLDQATQHDSPSTRLIHANDWLHEAMQTTVHPSEASSGAAIFEWFAPHFRSVSRKRGLLATHGIGTVDQILLGSLQSKHFWLRLFALSGKVVIFDEVHAYDSYMNELFLRLLEWLRYMGTSVIVLSATLPVSTRAAMEAAWGINKPSHKLDYPAITHAGETIHISKASPPNDKQSDSPYPVQFVPHDPSVKTVALHAKALKAQGLTVGVIVNTVARAQALSEELPDATLYHSRFTQHDRAKIKDTVEKNFGKTSDRQGRILIATQIAEQSLDLDVDVLFTDLCPIDMLIQREGRRKRHERNNRPEADNTVYVLYDAKTGATEGSKVIYACVVLDRTRAALTDQETSKGKEFTFPFDTRDLIEEVYAGDDSPEWEAFQKMNAEHRGTAQLATIPCPLPSKASMGSLIQSRAHTSTNNEPESAALQIHTRLTLPSFTLIVLETATSEWTLAHGPVSPIQANCERALSFDNTKLVFEASLKLSTPKLYRAICEADPQCQWSPAFLKNNPAFQYTRPLYLQNGRTSVNGQTLVYSSHRGLESK